MRLNRTNFFAKDKTSPFTIKGLTGELNTSDADFDIQDNQFSGGQNMVPSSATSHKKRDGINLYGSFLGSGTGVDGGWSFVGQNGTQEELVVWNGSLYRLVGSTWTAVTGVTLTAGLPCSGVYFADTNKFYIVNGTDYVVKYQAGSTSGDQTDTAFPLGKYVCTFQGHLIVGNITNYPNQFDYSAAGVDTFTTGTDFVVLPGEFNIAITGMINFNNNSLIISTKRRFYRLQGFTFDGTRSWVQQIYELPGDFGAIYERTMQLIGGYLYFVGQDTSNVAGIYISDGYTSQNISYSKILATTQSLNANKLSGACAVSDSVFYRVYVPELSQATNNLGIVYDTSKKIFLTPERRWVNGIADFSCLWSVEHSGVWQIYAGSSTLGQVFKLHGNDGLYDELPEEKYVAVAASSNAVDLAVDANPAKRVAMSFKMSQYNITNLAVPVIEIGVYLKKNAGTNTNLTIRIETDNAGSPSGTLVDAAAHATILASSITSSYTWIVNTFATNLSGNTTYWIVIEHVTENTGNSQYYALGNTSGTYSNGHIDTIIPGWIVSGAGTADYNGTYFINGTYNGKPAYQKNDSSAHWIFWGQPGTGVYMWFMSGAKADPVVTPAYVGTSSDLPSSWSASSGASPAPTLSAVTWSSSGANSNLVFIIYNKAPIDGFFDSKAFLPNEGKEFVLRKYQTIFSNLSTNSVVMQIGFGKSSQNTFTMNNLILAGSGGELFGTTAEGGSNDVFGETSQGGSNIIFGTQAVKDFSYTDVSSFTERMLKIRIRNNQINQQFEFNQFKAILVPRMRDF